MAITLAQARAAFTAVLAEETADKALLAAEADLTVEMRRREACEPDRFAREARVGMAAELQVERCLAEGRGRSFHHVTP